MQKSKANRQTRRTGGGFSAIELLITATILTIVTGLGVMGISRAKASIRLSGAAREYASYIEKARLFSIRRHADNASERASVAINDDKSSYNVTMDLDGDGDMDSRTITLPSGITFDTVETIAFDWRGRTWNTVGALTSSNAQVSIRLRNSSDSISIDVTGSGDVTIDSKVFDDSVPNVTLHVTDLASGATPVPTPDAVATPTPSPAPVATPDVSLDPTATPTPDPGGSISVPIPTPSATPTPTPTATPTPTPTATPRATPTPVTCLLSADQTAVTMHLDDSVTIKVSVTSSGSVSISGSSSKPSDLQVSGGAQNVASGAYATFILKAKKVGELTATFSSSCDTKIVPVVIIP
jgi:Tfp pilus assembly protein FimT